MEGTNYYGQIELNALGDIVRNHPELVKVVTGKDGKQRKFIDVYFNQRQQPNNYGYTHYLRVGIKKDEKKEGVNYYVGDFKPSDNQGQAQEREAKSEDVNDLAF